jgi:hypothetical protein
MGSIKKSAMNRSVESRLLTQLSKAALVDILIEIMRLNAGECDTELSPEAVVDLCAPMLHMRGDKLPIIDSYVRTGYVSKSIPQDR